MEGPSKSITQASREGKIYGSKICSQAPTITHLLFVDDSFLFFKANESEALAIKSLLSNYENQSGQPINLQKSGIMISSNVHTDKQSKTKEVLLVQNDLANSKYVGVPSLVGRSNKAVFEYVKERVWNRIQGWSVKLLSQAGKAVLIKNMAQANPHIACLASYYQNLCARISSE